MPIKVNLKPHIEREMADLIPLSGARSKAWTTGED